MAKKKSTTKKSVPKKAVVKNEPEPMEFGLIKNTPTPFWKTVWLAKWTLLWALLVVTVTKVVYTDKRIDEDNNFYFRYYFANRYYSPTFWLFLVLMSVVSLLSQGIPGLWDCWKANFTNGDEDSYTLTGTFTETHMKTHLLKRKFLDFVLVYGNA
jgi:hypothetical protein